MPPTPPAGSSKLILEKIAALPGRLGCDPLYIEEYNILIVLCDNEHEISGQANTTYTHYIRAYDLTATPTSRLSLHGDDFMELPLLWYISSEKFLTVHYSAGRLHCATESGIYQLDVLLGLAESKLRDVGTWTYIDLGESIFPPLDHGTNLFVLSKAGTVTKISKLNGSVLARKKWGANDDVEVAPVICKGQLIYLTGWKVNSIDLTTLDLAWVTEIRDVSLTGDNKTDIFEAVFDARKKMWTNRDTVPTGLFVVGDCAVITFQIFWTPKSLEFMLEFAPCVPGHSKVWATGAFAEIFGAFWVDAKGRGRMFPIATEAGDPSSLPVVDGLPQNLGDAPIVQISYLLPSHVMDDVRLRVFKRYSNAKLYFITGVSAVGRWLNDPKAKQTPCLIGMEAKGDLTISDVEIVTSSGAGSLDDEAGASVRWSFFRYDDDKATGIEKEVFVVSGGRARQWSHQYTIGQLIGTVTSPVAVGSGTVAFAARWHRDDFQMEDWLIVASP